MAQLVKNLLAIRKTQEMQVDPWVRKIPWRRAWLSTPVLLPGKFHGQRSLTGCRPWGHKELDMTEQLSLHFMTHSHSPFAVAFRSVSTGTSLLLKSERLMGSASELWFLLFLHKISFLYKDYAPWNQKNRILSLFSVCLDIYMWLSGQVDWFPGT